MPNVSAHATRRVHVIAGGNIGPPGQPGAQGATGPTGPPGAVEVNATPTQPSTPTPGVMWVDTSVTPNRVFVYTTTGWTEMRGDAGAPGATGATGATGPASTVPGPQGPPGEWTALTQAQYDALSPPDPDMLYIIMAP